MNLTQQMELLEARMKKMIHLHRSLQDELNHLRNNNEQLKTTIHKQQDQIRQLEEGKKALQLAHSLQNGADPAERSAMKSKINEVIKDIDACLALLNK
jgi:predicted  nucleic acid-binding Zn-ribbon protein